MLVTLFTDAGLCPETKSASWASWCKSEKGVARSGGILKDGYACSTAAESAAAINGIYHCLSSRVASSGDTILVQTDNNGVEGFLNGSARGYRKHAAQRKVLQDAYQNIILKHNLIIRFRHVRGHQGAKDKRSAVNTYCDNVCSFFLAWARHEANPQRWPQPKKQRPYGV